MCNKYYTLIGSRSTPQDVLDQLTNLALKLGNNGWIGRSGGAVGADQCLEDAYYSESAILDFRINVYLPWDNFNNKSSDGRGYANSCKLKTYKKAGKIAEELHPNWEACSYGVRSLHTRNVYQILGYDLQQPSKFVVCYAEPVSGGFGMVKGGTGTAVKLAVDLDIPVYNFWYEDRTEEIIHNHMEEN